MNVAEDVARRSLCVRDHVGAVVVDPRQRIVATGYNGPPAGFPHADTSCTNWCERGLKQIDHFKDYVDCPSLHAEANALSVCDRAVREGGSIYVSSEVCFDCAKQIANSGLRDVVYRSRGNSHRDTDKVDDFLMRCGITVVVIAS